MLFWLLSVRHIHGFCRQHHTCVADTGRGFIRPLVTQVIEVYLPAVIGFLHFPVGKTHPVDKTTHFRRGQCCLHHGIRRLSLDPVALTVRGDELVMVVKHQHQAMRQGRAGQGV